MVRHGESMGNVWPGAYQDDRMNFLSLRGMKQAELAGIDLERRGLEFDHVITSGLTRARQTAAIIMQIMNDWQRQYESDDRLNELDFEGGEIQRDHTNRVVAAMAETVMPMLETGNVLCVTHHFTMQVIFDYLNIDRKHVIAEGAICPNAVPFFYHPKYPRKLFVHHEWQWIEQH